MKRAGYSGFSYADVSRIVGIRKASIHHHFPTKEDLAVAAVRRYRERLQRALADVPVGVDASLRAVVGLYVEAFHSPGGGCLCAALAVDWDTLPEGLQAEILAYRTALQDWLARALEGEAGAVQAQLVLSLLEGASTAARVQGDPALFEHLVPAVGRLVAA